MIDKAERRGHHIRKRRPLRVIRHRADAKHAQHRIHRANRDKFIQKPLVAILKRELLKKHVVDQRMLKENRPIRRDLVQMTSRACISFLAPVRAAEQRQRRLAMRTDAAAPLVNLPEHGAGCLQRAPPIRLIRQRIRRQWCARKQRLDARLVLPPERRIHLPERLAERHQPLRQRERPPLHDLDEIQPNPLRLADGFKEERPLCGLRRIQLQIGAHKPNRLFLPHHQLDHGLAAIRTGALVSVLHANPARIEPADGRQRVRAQHRMHRTASVRQM